MPAARVDLDNLDVPSWINELFVAIDAKDAQAFGNFLTENADFTFGNAPTVHGKSAVIDAVAGFFTSIAALRHRVTQVVSQANVVVCCGEVEYTRHDGSHVSIPFADSFTMQADKISDYRIYMDISSLYAEPQ